MGLVSSHMYKQFLEYQQANNNTIVLFEKMVENMALTVEYLKQSFSTRGIPSQNISYEYDKQRHIAVMNILWHSITIFCNMKEIPKALHREKDLPLLQQSLEDRFGTIPSQTLELFQIVKLRMLAKKIYAEKISIKQNKMAITFNFQSNAVERILSYVQSYPTQSSVSEQEDKVVLSIKSIDNLDKAIKVFTYLQEDFV
jgi:hypothetical protein